MDPERAREGEPVSNVRTIFSSSWKRCGEEFIYTVRGSGFSHHMVRNLVGTFILIGKGSLQVQDITRILQGAQPVGSGCNCAGTRIVSSRGGVLTRDRETLFYL